MLENGTDIGYIQSFLGHASIKTTMVYTHLGKSAVNKIQSPLDRLVANERQKKLEQMGCFKINCYFSVSEGGFIKPKKVT